MSLLTPEQLAHDPLLHVTFYDHYSYEGKIESIKPHILEAVGWLIDQDDVYLRLAWLRDDFRNEFPSINGESCMLILKSTIISQNEISLV
ncbi:hypothetical protein KAR91_49135 [Candidatus Pacearchaeota archaeon]|nr:hypothetical protein [Candidatus Pacearchaeota archaeon]